VIANAATERWLSRDGRAPAWIHAANRASAPLARRIPPALQERAARSQRAGQPFLGPRPPSAGDPDSLVDSGPLYAGIGVGAIHDVRPAGELVAELRP
jgi:hypothetical protein